MIYNIKRIDDDTIHHEIGGQVFKQVGITEIDDLQTYLQDLVNQRKQIFKITKITNDLGIKLK
jgi:hypothetical protein|tara:strand:+ start:347 stop:535 length:189 start_codon:yes stop_codon:yes gene_type:complete